MSIEFKDSKIIIDLHRILNGVTGQQKIELIKKLAIDGDIMRYTISILCDGLTDTKTDSETKNLNWASVEIAKHSNDISKREIERLEKIVNYQVQELFELKQENGWLMENDNLNLK